MRFENDDRITRWIDRYILFLCLFLLAVVVYLFVPNIGKLLHIEEWRNINP